MGTSTASRRRRQEYSSTKSERFRIPCNSMVGSKSAADHLSRSPLEIAKSGTFRGKKPDFGVGGGVGGKLDSEKF